MAGKTILETARLVLREFDEDDAVPFHALLSDPAIIRYTGDPAGGTKSVEQSLEVLRSRTLADYRKYGFGRWACVHKASGVLIGFSGLKYLDDIGEVDIGYRFLPAYWGVGLATESARPVLEYGFTRLRLGRIIGLVDPANDASVRVLEKLGMVRVGEEEFRGQRVIRYVAGAAVGGNAGR
jgi:RimJ/RimL family protein N-acetyltransferase